MAIADLYLYPMSGFAVGLIVGLTGVGGGSLMTPLLVLLFGIHPKTAVGTDLLYAAATKTFGTLVHNKGGTVDWSIVRRLAMGSVPATLLTLLLLQHVEHGGKETGALIAYVLGYALVFTSVATLFRKPIVDFATSRLGEMSEPTVARWTVISGAILGILVTLSSVGAGALGMTMLLILYPRVPLVKLVGADIAHAVPLTLIAGAGYWLAGGVDFTLLTNLLIGSIPGIMIGSWLAPRTPDFGLRTMLALVLMAVGLKLVKVY